MADLVGGSVQMTIDSMAATLPHIKAGKLRALAIAQLERSPVLPEVPTLAETYPGFDGSPMNYLAVRGGTPRAIVDRLNQEVNAVLALPAIKQRLLDMGVTTPLSTPEEIARQVDSEREKWRKVIEAAGVKVE
jgi:tripartite-type tricarboxylate transporter receptor subunit TctC